MADPVCTPSTLAYADGFHRLSLPQLTNRLNEAGIPLTGGKNKANYLKLIRAYYANEFTQGRFDLDPEFMILLIKPGDLAKQLGSWEAISVPINAGAAKRTFKNFVAQVSAFRRREEELEQDRTAAAAVRDREAAPDPVRQRFATQGPPLRGQAPDGGRDVQVQRDAELARKLEDIERRENAMSAREREFGPQRDTPRPRESRGWGDGGGLPLDYRSQELGPRDGPYDDRLPWQRPENGWGDHQNVPRQDGFGQRQIDKRLRYPINHQDDLRSQIPIRPQGFQGGFDDDIIEIRQQRPAQQSAELGYEGMSARLLQQSAGQRQGFGPEGGGGSRKRTNEFDHYDSGGPGQRPRTEGLGDRFEQLRRTDGYLPRQNYSDDDQFPASRGQRQTPMTPQSSAAGMNRETSISSRDSGKYPVDITFEAVQEIQASYLSALQAEQSQSASLGMQGQFRANWVAGRATLSSLAAVGELIAQLFAFNQYITSQQVDEYTHQWLNKQMTNTFKTAQFLILTAINSLNERTTVRSGNNWVPIQMSAPEVDAEIRKTLNSKTDLFTSATHANMMRLTKAGFKGSATAKTVIPEASFVMRSADLPKPTTAVGGGLASMAQRVNQPGESMVQRPCYICGEIGHYQNRCPQKPGPGAGKSTFKGKKKSKSRQLKLPSTAGGQSGVHIRNGLRQIRLMASERTATSVEEDVATSSFSQDILLPTADTQLISGEGLTLPQCSDVFSSPITPPAEDEDEVASTSVFVTLLPDDLKPITFFDLPGYKQFREKSHLAVPPLEVPPAAEGDILNQPIPSVSITELIDTGWFGDNTSLLNCLARSGGDFGFFNYILNKYEVDIAPDTSELLRENFDVTNGYDKRLRQAHLFWSKVICPPEWVLNGIQKGFELEWEGAREDTPEILIINSAARYTEEQITIGNLMIQQHVDTKICAKRAGPGRVNLGTFMTPKDVLNTNPLKRYRLILNGHPLGEFLLYEHFSLQRLIDWLKQVLVDDECCGLDITNAYYVFALNPVEWEYVCFSFPDNKGEIQWYNYLVLPQGISTSARIFETAIDFLRQWIAAETTRAMFGFYDDMRMSACNAGESRAITQQRVEIMFGATVAGGFPISWPKSIVRPVKQFPAVGHEVSTSRAIKLAVSNKRWQTSRYLLNQELATCKSSPRSLAVIGGGIESDSWVLDNSRLHLRGVFSEMKQALVKGWDFIFDRLPLSKCQLDLEFFAVKFNGARVWKVLDFKTPIQIAVDLEGFTDAGAAAVGGALYLQPQVTETDLQEALLCYSTGVGKPGFPPRKRLEGIPSEPLQMAANLLPCQYDLASAVREMHAILIFLLTFAPVLKGKSIRLFVDNWSIIFILKNGSNKEACQLKALEVEEVRAKLEVTLCLVWLPRDWNSLADWLSHQVILDDYFLAPYSFKRICAAFKVTPEVDLYASSTDRQPACAAFVSKFFQPDCAFPDASTLDWSVFFRSGYAFPPVGGLNQFFDHLTTMSNFECVVVFPLWRGKRYMRYILPDGRHFRKEVKAYQFLLRGVDIKLGAVGRPGFLTPPYSGHKYMFIAILWRSGNWVPRLGVGGEEPRSRFRYRFCLKRHCGGVCTECLIADKFVY
jgi:Zinc knuckle